MRKDDPHPPVTGLVAGKYELVGLIGRGGMGSVWEGRHQSLGTRVAIKFIESEYSDSAEARSRFDNEARAAAKLQSKHAIQIYDHGVSESGKPYIVMELLTGEPLDKRLDRVPRMPLAEVARILQQVCRALGRAHQLGITHRDLKPENIFLVRTPDEDEEIAKVLDFGIAKFAQPQALGISSGTKTGAVLGTPFYMSPEQARGLRSIDHRSDLWSLGVIAYRCLTGVLPFDGESVGDLLVKICTSPLPLPSQRVPELSSQFDAWFARALEREPDKRFQTAQELSDALGAVAGFGPRRSTDPARPSRTPVPPTWNAGSTSQPAPANRPMSVAPSGGPAPAGLAAAATQAQFTATGRRTQAGSRSVWLASALAAVVGLTGGVAAVVKLSGGAPEKHAVASEDAAVRASTSGLGSAAALRESGAVPLAANSLPADVADTPGLPPIAVARDAGARVTTRTPDPKPPRAKPSVAPPAPPPVVFVTPPAVKPPKPPATDPGY